MGGRDYRHREAKKPKKAARLNRVEELVPSVEVAVVAKKSKARKETDTSD